MDKYKKDKKKKLREHSVVSYAEVEALKMNRDIKKERFEKEYDK